MICWIVTAINCCATHCVYISLYKHMDKWEYMDVYNMCLFLCACVYNVCMTVVNCTCIHCLAVVHCLAVLVGLKFVQQRTQTVFWANFISSINGDNLDFFRGPYINTVLTEYSSTYFPFCLFVCFLNKFARISNKLFSLCH